MFMSYFKLDFFLISCFPENIISVLKEKYNYYFITSMDNVFNTLIARPTAQIQTNLGNPWEIIPIKNKKYAKECTEIHLAGRNIDNLTNFEDFPNLEVLWINNNKVKTNFRLALFFSFKRSKRWRIWTQIFA